MAAATSLRKDPAWIAQRRETGVRAARHLRNDAPPFNRDDRDVEIWLAARTQANAVTETTAFDLFFDYRDYLARWPFARPLSAASFHLALDAHGFAPAVLAPGADGKKAMIRPGLALKAASIDDCVPVLPPGYSLGKVKPSLPPDAADPYRRELLRLRKLLSRVATLGQGGLAPQGDLLAAVVTASRGVG